MKEPQGKSKSEEILNCNSCSIQYLKKDHARHKLWCKAGENDNDKDKLTVEQSDFETLPLEISEKCLHGFQYGHAILVGPTVFDVDAPQDLRFLGRTRFGERVVLINPKSMRRLHLRIGDHVGLSTSVGEEKLPAVAWPSTAVAQFSLGIPKSSAAIRKFFATTSSKNLCAIGKLQSMKSAACIRLKPASLKTFYSSEGFHRSCRLYLDGSCLLEGEDKLTIPYFGQNCEFRSLATASKSSIDVVEAFNLLSERLSAIDMNGEGDTSILDADDSSSNVSSFINTSRTSTPKRTDLDKSIIIAHNVRMPMFPVRNDETFLVVGQSTEIIIDQADQSCRKPMLNFKQLGGMANVKKVLSDHVTVCLRSDLNSSELIKTILLYGHSGCGKSSLAEAAAAESDSNFFRIDMGLPTEDTQETLHLLAEAERTTPCILLLDDVDFQAGQKEHGLSRFRQLADWIEQQRRSDKPIVVIATATVHDRVPASFRKLFQLDLEIPVPSALDRQQIIEVMLSGRRHELASDDIVLLADSTHGFTPSDLNVLTRESSVLAALDQSPLRLPYFRLSLEKIRPSAMREIFFEIPKVRWTDIGGNEKLKLQLRQAVEWPLKHQDAFLRLGITPPTGVLMYGPPGCSKTMIAKALATESGLNFISVKGPELFSKWVGESERAVREIFRKARQVSPSIIFFDEIDALGSERTSGAGAGSSNVGERVLAQLLTELDGVQPLNNVTIVAATNRPDVIDTALIRPGRLDRLIYVPLPDEETRNMILKLQLRKIPISDDVHVDELIAKTAKYTGAELVAVCREAALFALEEDLDAHIVQNKHFDQALLAIQPRTSSKLLKIYSEFQRCFEMHS